MYALVDGSTILLGPIKFNYRMINSVLEEELELEERVSSVDESRVPFNITDTVKIVSAANQYSPEYNPRYHEHTGPTVSVYENEVIFSYGIREKPLDQIKSERKGEIAPYRKEKENSTIDIEINGTQVKVSTSRDNRIALTSKAMSGDGPYNFKFGRETWIEITKSDIENILQQIDSKVQEAFDWELAKNQEIDACRTVDEVLNVVIRPSINLI